MTRDTLCQHTLGDNGEKAFDDGGFTKHLNSLLKEAQVKTIPIVGCSLLFFHIALDCDLCCNFAVNIERLFFQLVVYLNRIRILQIWDTYADCAR